MVLPCSCYSCFIVCLVVYDAGGCLVVLFGSLGICVACGLHLGWFSWLLVVFVVRRPFSMLFAGYIACVYVLGLVIGGCLGFPVCCLVC